ncbi:MAG: hypothetical protein ACLFUL_14620 [Desulfobacteraceae bacterium]
MDFKLSPEMESKIVQRVQAEQEKTGGLSETERKKLVGRVAKEVITEGMIADFQNTIGQAAAINPEAKEMAIRELKAGTPLEEVQRKLLDLMGVTADAGKGQAQAPLSFKNVSDDEFLQSLAEPVTFRDENPTAPKAKRMNDISVDDFARSLSNPAQHSLGG